MKLLNQVSNICYDIYREIHGVAEPSLFIEPSLMESLDIMTQGKTGTITII